MSGIVSPRFVVVDQDHPVRDVLDTGGVPGEEMRLLLRVGATMRGVYAFRRVNVHLDIGASFDGEPYLVPTVRVMVERTFKDLSDD